MNSAPLVAGSATAATALGRFAQTATRVGAGLTAAVSLPIIAVGGIMVSQSVKIEDAWNEVRATYNATPAEIEKLIAPTGLLGKSVTDLSTKYGLARDEVISLLGQLSQMGFTGKKATDTLTQGIEFAVAAGLKLQDGLNLVVAITNTFGLSGSKLADTLRGLNNVENETAASGYDIQKALTRAGGAAEAMTGPTFSSSDAVASLAAGMAVLKANGQETARSADALRAIFQRLYTPTDKVQALFDKMGVKLKDAKGQIVPFPKLLQDLANNFDKLTPYEQLQFGKKSIGVEFGPLLLTLIKDSQKASKGQSIYNNTLKDFQDKAKGAKAYSQELAVRQDSLRVSLGKVKAQFGLLVDEMRPAISSALKPIASWIGKIAVAFQKMSPKAQKTAVMVGLLLAVVGPLVLIVAALAAAVAAVGWEFFAVVGIIVGVIVIIRKVQDASSGAAKVIKAVLSVALKNLKGSFTDIVAALKALMPLWKLLAVVLTGAVLGAILIISAALRIIAFVLKYIAIAVGWFVKEVVKFFQWLYDILVGHSIIPDLMNAIIYWFEFLAKPVIAAVQLIVTTVETLWSILSTVVTGIVSALVDVVIGLFTIMWAGIQAGLQIAVAAFTAGMQIFQAIATFVWTTIVTIVTTAINLVATNLGAALQIIQTLWSAVWAEIQLYASTVWATISTIVSTAMAVIQGVIKLFLDIIHGNWSAAWKDIKGIGSTIMSGIESLISIGMKFISGTISIVLNAIKGVWSTIWNAIKSNASSVWSAIKSIVSSAVGTLKSVISSAINAIKTTVSSGMNFVRTTISTAINTAKNVWSTAWNTFKTVVSSAVSYIEGLVKGMLSVVSSTVGKVKSLLGSVKGGLSKAGSFLGLNSGGLVPGTGNKDTVPTMLTPGEYVITKRAVRQIGVANLNRLNSQSGGKEVLQAAAKDVAPSVGGVAVQNLMMSYAPKVEAPKVLAAVGAAPIPGSVDNRQYTYEINTTVVNPQAEKASDSVQRRATRLAAMGLFGSKDK